MGVQYRLEDRAPAQGDRRVDTRHLRSPRRPTPSLVDYGAHLANVLGAQRLRRQMDAPTSAWRCSA